MITLKYPVSVGDKIEVKGNEGEFEVISLIYTESKQYVAVASSENRINQLLVKIPNIIAKYGCRFSTVKFEKGMKVKAKPEIASVSKKIEAINKSKYTGIEGAWFIGTQIGFRQGKGARIVMVAPDNSYIKKIATSIECSSMSIKGVS